jgi:uncharacterized protein YjbI with pentapeptide repeats
MTEMIGKQPSAPRPRRMRDISFHLLGGVAKVESSLESAARRAKQWSIFEFLELAGRLSIVVGVVFWVAETNDRLVQKHYRAWQVIASATGLTGDGGRKDALQDLNAEQVNLHGAPLSSAFLRNVNLVGAKLANAHMSHADLVDAKLGGAHLEDAELQSALLSQADLSSASMTRAVLDDANLLYAQLTNSDLTGAHLVRATLASANLSGAVLKAADLSEAILASAKLVGADLAGACLIRADLTDAWLAKADLSGANLSDANLAGAHDLSQAKFCATIMDTGEIKNPNCAAPLANCPKM